MHAPSSSQMNKVTLSCWFRATCLQSRGGLSATVARNLAVEKNAFNVVIPPEAVLIAATHTHQGPGNFLTAQAFNAYASISGGFSRELLDYLTSQVTESIRRAMRDALENADKVSFSMHSAPIAEQIQMNRSPRTFLLNWNSQALMNTLHPTPESRACVPDVETWEATNDWDLPGCPRLRAADPVMSVLAIRRGTTLVGMLVFFAVHPTVLDAAAPFNSADFTGYAMARLERETGAPDGSRPVAAFFNGAEGDIVAQRGRRDLIETTSVGDNLVQAVRDVLGSPARMLPNPLITTARFDIGPGESCGGQSFAKQPVAGVALLGGGENDRTILYSLGWRAGVRDVAGAGQGGKLPAFDSQLLRGLKMTSVLAGPGTFPHRLPVSYVHFGELAIAAFPAELSTASGILVRKMAGNLAHGSFEIIGLANEYTNYTASPNEYAAQDYMGASTLWGPYEGPVFACQLTKGATAPVSSVAKQKFDPGASHLRGGLILSQLGGRGESRGG